MGFYNWDGISIEGAIVCEVVDRPFIKKCFHYVFNELGAKRFFVRVQSSNEKALSFDKRLGFVEEGILREAGLDGSDVHVLAMLRSEYEQSKWYIDGRKIDTIGPKAA